MILTGDEIVRAHRDGEILIEPFSADQVNPNSYNFRLGETLRVYDEEVLDPRRPNRSTELHLGAEGYVLEPGRLYLAHTVERLGGDVYAPTFAARSSVARLGIFINLSASLGDIGYAGQWTLQLFAAAPVRVYPGMPIGQMMWWKRHGEVDLYRGKYQGSVGPRTSDIHVDFARTSARATFPRLGSDVDSADTGAKFATLSKLSGHLAVPDGFSIPCSVLDESLDAELLADAQRVLDDVRATVGAFLGESAETLTRLAARLQLAPQTRELLAVRTRELLEARPGAALAVRSSGLAEDGAEHSQAGLHRSILGLTSVEAVLAAVEDAWRAWFELPAVLARVRSGDFSAAPRLALFVQLMVDPEHAGVAFSRSGPGAVDDAAVQVDHVDGLGDELVSGVGEASSWASGEPLPEGTAGQAVTDVEALVRSVRELLGHEVDVEWAWAEGVAWLLQARPVTVELPGERVVGGPHLEVAGLYDGSLPQGFELGSVSSVYASYVAKRGPAHRLAREHGFATGRGLVVACNTAGLEGDDVRRPLEDFLAGAPVDEFVLDLSANVRQVICSTGQVRDVLRDHVAGRPRGSVGQAVLRPFLRGQFGVITSLAPEGVLVEVAPEGLLALNRGTAAALQAVVRPDGVQALDDLPAVVRSALRDVAPRLREFAEAMQQQFGALTLEWVLHEGALWFTDYSVPPSAADGFVLSGRTMSAGTHSGPVVDLRADDEVLDRLSVGPAVSIDKSLDVLDHGPLADVVARVRAAGERPVVRASRPYAVLSVLLDEVGAFVFDGGSSLCHLAILVREAKIPAVVAVGELPPRVLIADGEVVPA